MIAHINNNEDYETLDRHLNNVAQYGKMHMSRYGFPNNLYLAGMLHDFGKGTKMYEHYIMKAHTDPKSAVRGSVNHSSAGGKLIFDNYYKGTEYEKLTAQMIACLVTSHHGVFDCLTLDGKKKFMDRVHPKEDIQYEEALQNISAFLQKQDIERLFKNAVNEIKDVDCKLKNIADQMNGIASHDFLRGCLERFLLSALMDADRTCTAEFMEGVNVEQITKCENITLLWKECKRNLEKKLNTFTKTDKISVLRKRMSEECLTFGGNETGIYTLPIPTGGGKTFGAYRFALEHALQKKKERIIYVAPFLSILEQNSKEIKEVLQQDEYILEHHSNIVRESKNNGEDYDRYDMLMETWNSPLIFTTMVQFLNTLFSGKTQCIRRMNKLANSIIIVDEIQSLPLKCVHLFNGMMNFLSGICGTTVILCSATQPLLGEVEKKILYSQPISMIHDIDSCAKAFERVEIVPAMIPGGYNSATLSEFALEKLQDNMLIILNTKSAVRRVYNELIAKKPDDVQLIQLTTYMCAAHRADIIKRLKEKLKNGEKVICISSQLIEAGVDISFQCVIRSLAGLDSIMQAAGRCNRHGELAKGIVYVINCNEENLSKLPEIVQAGEATETVLRYFEQNRESLNNSLLSTKAMDCFYHFYFRQRNKEFDYLLKRGKHITNTSIYELLSDNKIGRLTYKSDNEKNCDLPLKQAFQYAGKYFEVIGNETIGIIAPYKEAKQIIETIRNSYDTKSIMENLKKLQPYTINVYEHDKVIDEADKRNGIDTSVLDGRILILEEGFYDEHEGVKATLQLEIF
jgi:CRISPR-associated helicase Cas3/CRISPR-associated endonuclease Cas3-HD